MSRLKRLWPIPLTRAPGISGLLALLLVAVLFIAASASAHEALHENSASGPGHCVVCLLLHGQVAPVDTVVAIVCLATALALFRAPTDFRRTPVAQLLPPGRGPPVPALAV